MEIYYNRWRLDRCNNSQKIAAVVQSIVHVRRVHEVHTWCRNPDEAGFVARLIILMIAYGATDGPNALYP